MSDAIYHLTVIVLAALGVIRGWRSGLEGEAASLLGMSFGIVCAHIFFDPVYAWIVERLPDIRLSLGGDYLLRLLSASIVYTLCFLLLESLSAILRSAMSVFPSGVLGSIAGSLICMAKYLFFVSICFNLIVDYNPYSSLLKFANDGDGNVVAVVMSVAPAALGVPGCDDLFHARRLEEAKKISLLRKPATQHPDPSIRFISDTSKLGLHPSPGSYLLNSYA